MASYYISNPPTNIGMDNFLAVNDSHEGLAKSCRYVARITPVGEYLLDKLSVMRDLTYLCEATEFPGRGFQTVDVRYYGPTFKMPYNTQYEDMNMTFLCRSDSLEREFFDDWMTIINPINSFDFNYRDDYRCRIELFQFSDLDDGTGNPSVEYQFSIEDAYPVLVSPQQVTWADDQFLRLGVTFTYRFWKRPGVDPEPRGTFSLIQGANIT